MSRTTKNDGRIMFSDESVAPWLRNQDFGKMIIENNSLYGAGYPIDLLPFSASDVKLEWIICNCFYKISFVNNFNQNCINPEIDYKSPRGGSMSKRYYGKIDGINEKLKNQLIEFAKQKKISQNSLIEDAISLYLKKNS